MDRINSLSDDLLVRILSFLPTKVAVSTTLLSKRWDCLWMWLPKLDYHCSSVSESKKLRCFLNKNLPLHRAPVIEIFRLKLTHGLRSPEDIKLWVEVAISRHLHELEILSKAFQDNNILPNSLYACKSLVILKLDGSIRLDVPPMACLSSLKTLQLDNVTGLDEVSFGRLLSICPVLENLSLDFYYRRISGPISIPTLQSLTLYTREHLEGLKIDTPSLKYLTLEVLSRECHMSVVNMPKLEEAYLDVRCNAIESLIASITSVKRLTICCPKAVYSDSSVFNHLAHLKLCACTDCSANLLARVMKDSPNLRVLDIFRIVDHDSSNTVNWNQPSTVPECFQSSLQTFNWSKYLGRPRDKDFVVYILKNACRIKTVEISAAERAITKKFQMIKELSSSSRASTTCQLIFD